MAKNTKRKTMLIVSLSAILLSVVMLVGSTFAWFTDSVTSAQNTIQSGNLDITLEYFDGDSWEDVQDKSDILTGELWEPGYVDVAYLRMKNEGSLALKYQLGVNIVSETEGVNQAGERFKLSDYIYFDVIEGVNGETNAYTNRDAALAVATQNIKISDGYSKADSMLADANDLYFAMIVHMPTIVGNEANHDGANVPQIDLGINLFAIQHAYEKDSFDETYDVTSFVSNYGMLLNDETKGNSSNFVLIDDFDLNKKTYFGDNTSNSIDLNGYTLGTSSDAFFGTQGYGCTLSIGGEGTLTTENNFAVFASTGGTLYLNGGTYELGDTNEKAPFYAQNDATIVINDGEFISSDANTPIVYCINAFVEINGGFFQNIANSKQALLSMGNNLNYVNNQKITLRGGTFVNWNPMNSAFAMDWPQAPAMIVLAEGYKMISETQANGDIWYMVVPA